MRKKLPQVYSWYSEDNFVSMTKSWGKRAFSDRLPGEWIRGHPVKGVSRHKEGGQAKRKNTPPLNKFTFFFNCHLSGNRPASFYSPVPHPLFRSFRFTVSLIWSVPPRRDNPSGNAYDRCGKKMWHNAWRCQLCSSHRRENGKEEGFQLKTWVI